METLLDPRLAQHLPVFLMLTVILAGIVGTVVSLAFRIFFLNEKRIERMVSTVLNVTLASPTFTETVKGIADSFTAPARTEIRDLVIRDNERAETLRRAHERIDKLTEAVNGHVIDIYKRLPAGQG